MYHYESHVEYAARMRVLLAAEKAAEAKRKQNACEKVNRLYAAALAEAAAFARAAALVEAAVLTGKENDHGNT